LLVSDPMRPPVLHVIPYLWSGAGGVLTQLCEAQRRDGPVTIVTTGSSGEHADWPAYRKRLRDAGVGHHTIDFFRRDPAIFWDSATRLSALIRRLAPAVIHAHAGVPACGAIAARTMAGSRARVIGQMYSWGPGRPVWMDRQDTCGFAQTDRVICSARAYWDLLVRHDVPARKLVYLPWGLPLDRLVWRGDAATGAAAPIIGFVGRIEPRKGQLELVEAFARLRRLRPEARLELIGPDADPDYAARVRAIVARHGLGDAVTLTGRVRDVVPRVRRWSLFVSLSSDEGQGLAVLEAMALGVPVLARPVAGISDFLRDGRTGLTIPRAAASSSAGVIANAAHRALASPARLRTIARHARRVIERRYAWDYTVARFERLYWH
jgi:glycosyltransferase involved in cell wall biosynthesis